MHNDANCTFATRRVSRLTIAVSLICLPATPAYALTLDGVADTLSSSSWASFGLGCAAGAVVAGLVAGLVGTHARRRLEEQVEEAVFAAETAQQAAVRAEKLLEEAQRLVASQVQTSLSPASNVAAAPSADTRAEVSRATPQRDASQSTPAPTRARAEALEEGRVAKPMSPAERAAIIDARVPRFDQSLFPDLTHEASSQVDDFERAMEAMDETLSATLMLQDQRAADEAKPFGTEPEFSDAASYVDYLVQDEIERNRAGQARRFSRSKLTVFEGTGDIGSMRKSRPRPRHLAPSAREA